MTYRRKNMVGFFAGLSAEQKRKALEYRGYENHVSYDFCCDHIGIVSISETECQCMDCLRVWTKGKNFKSDWPELDRGYKS